MRDDYLVYLGTVRHLSPHTLESYGKDLEKFEVYLGAMGIAPHAAGVGDARGFVAWLTRQGLSPRSVNRMVSGVRGDRPGALGVAAKSSSKLSMVRLLMLFFYWVEPVQFQPCRT